MDVEGEVRGMASRAQWPAIRTYNGYLCSKRLSTGSTKGYKLSKSSCPAARELGVGKGKEVMEGYQGVVNLTPVMKTGNKVAVNECLLEMEKVIETFRETRRLLLSTPMSDLLVVS